MYVYNCALDRMYINNVIDRRLPSSHSYNQPYIRPFTTVLQRKAKLDRAARSRLREVAHSRVLPPLAREEHIELLLERREERIPELAI